MFYINEKILCSIYTNCKTFLITLGYFLKNSWKMQKRGYYNDNDNDMINITNKTNIANMTNIERWRKKELHDRFGLIIKSQMSSVSFVEELEYPLQKD